MVFTVSKAAMERGCNRVLAAFENVKPTIWLSIPGINRVAGTIDSRRRKPYKPGWAYIYVKELVLRGRLVQGKKLHGRVSRYRLASAKIEPEREIIRVKLAAGDNDTVFMLSALLHLDPPVVMHNALEAYKEQIRKRLGEK